MIAVFRIIAAATMTSTNVSAILFTGLRTVLFVGSMIFTESITRSKYPEYAVYQLRTSAALPWFLGTTPRPTS